VTSFFSECLSAVSKLSLYVGTLSFDCNQAVQHHRTLRAHRPPPHKNTLPTCHSQQLLLLVTAREGAV
jgi:hypothetical protein